MKKGSTSTATSEREMLIDLLAQVIKVGDIKAGDTAGKRPNRAEILSQSLASNPN